MVIIRSFTTPDEGLRHQQSDVKVIFNDNEIGKGTLYVYESVLGWKDDDHPQTAFCIEYPHISLHALSRDPSSYPVPCIYVMLDAHADLPGNLGLNASNGIQKNETESDNDSDSEVDITEIRLIPDDVNSLEAIYTTIGICQSLNPDPNDMSDDEYYDGEDMYADDFMEPDAERFESLHINGSGNIDEDKAFEDAD